MNNNKTDITGVCGLTEGTEMFMPGDHIEMSWR